jgi:hypothetical protein
MACLLIVVNHCKRRISYFFFDCPDEYMPSAVCSFPTNLKINDFFLNSFKLKISKHLTAF